MNSLLTALQTLPLSWLMGLVVLFSLCIGSFLNVVIYRLACRLGLSKPPLATQHVKTSRSFCPHCQTMIAWHDNIPLLSFILLKGRCRSCHATIAWQYPLVELATALVALIFLSRFGGSLPAVTAIVMSWWLIPLAVFDWRYFILPNELTFSLGALGLLYAVLGGPVSGVDALIGTLVGYGSFALIDTLYFLCRRQHGLGQGDWKLFAAFGACLGWQALLPILFIASFLATFIGLSLIATKRATLQSALPFGVFLTLAAMVVLLLDFHYGFNVFG